MTTTLPQRAYVASVFADLLEGLGASEDHEAARIELRRIGLEDAAINTIMARIIPPPADYERVAFEAYFKLRRNFAARGLDGEYVNLRVRDLWRAWSYRAMLGQNMYDTPEFKAWMAEQRKIGR